MDVYIHSLLFNTTFFNDDTAVRYAFFPPGERNINNIIERRGKQVNNLYQLYCFYEKAKLHVNQEEKLISEKNVSTLLVAPSKPKGKKSKKNQRGVILVENASWRTHFMAMMNN